ncbi:MAG: TonB-dependent receptor [Pseudomonadota bacterium]
MITSRSISKLSVVGTLLASTALASPAIAQDSETDGNEAEEADDRPVIMVTATRRQERVIDVPYNITSISGDEIEAARIFDNNELLRGIPGVSVVDRGFRNAGTVNQIRIRGLNVDSNALGDFATSSVATVSTYVNETPVFSNFLLRDVERVEVLRGPQGTLYGSGSLGGTVRFITRDPVLGEYGGYATASVSNVNGTASIGYSLDGALNIPLGDTLGLRLVGSYNDFPGITDYVNVYERDADGLPVAPDGVLAPTASFQSVEDADTVEQYMIRATLLFEPSDDVQIRLLYSRQEDEVGGRRAQTVGFDGFGREYQDNEIGSVLLEPSDREVDLVALEANIDLGFATLTSATSYYDTSGGSISENTGIFAQAGFLGFYYNYPRPISSAARTYSDSAFVQEVRLVSNGNDTIDWVVGGFYRDQDFLATQSTDLFGFERWFNTAFPFAIGFVTGDRQFEYSRDEAFEEIALFGEATWHVTEALDLTIGARYFDNSSRNDTFIDLPVYVTVSAPTDVTFEVDENDILFKGNLSYRFADDQLLYLTVSEGYRRGGTNAVPIAGNFAEDPDWQIYDADTVVNYEAGVKGRTGDITYDVSAFYIDWDAPQLNTATTNSAFFAVRNGTSARTYGFEAAIDGYIGNDFRYQLGYAHINADLTGDITAPEGFLLGSDGDALPGVPKHMINWAFTYDTPVSSTWSLYLRTDGNYQSSVRNSIGVSDTFNVPLEGFAFFNGTATLANGPLSVSVWVRNIFNEEGVTAVFTEEFAGTAPAVGYFGNGSREFLSLPRTVGATATFVF